jgi:hypothetical protein
MFIWLITTILAGYEVFLARHIAYYSYLWIVDKYILPVNIIERIRGIGIGNLASLVMAIIAIVIVVGGFDYHWEHAGEWKSYRVLAITIVFQLIILVLYIVLR